jgi:hypothetical protein
MTTHALVTLNTTTATLLSPYGVHSGVNISIQNVNESGYIYLGGENVSTTNYGFRIDPSSAIAFELDAHDGIYAVSQSNSLQAAIMTTTLAEL